MKDYIKISAHLNTSQYMCLTYECRLTCTMTGMFTSENVVLVRTMF